MYLLHCVDNIQCEMWSLIEYNGNNSCGDVQHRQG